MRWHVPRGTPGRGPDERWGPVLRVHVATIRSTAFVWCSPTRHRLDAPADAPVEVGGSRWAVGGGRGQDVVDRPCRASRSWPIADVRGQAARSCGRERSDETSRRKRTRDRSTTRRSMILFRTAERHERNNRSDRARPIREGSPCGARRPIERRPARARRRESLRHPKPVMSSTLLALSIRALLPNYEIHILDTLGVARGVRTRAPSVMRGSGVSARRARRRTSSTDH